LLASALGYIARKQTTKKTLPPIPLLHDVITGTDPKENIVSNPLLLHDVITGTDPKENTHCCIGYCVFIRAIATVVNTCHISYSIHVTVSLTL
jgi:hypothetical protein